MSTYPISTKFEDDLNEAVPPSQDKELEELIQFALEYVGEIEHDPSLAPDDLEPEKVAAVLTDFLVGWHAVCNTEPVDSVGIPLDTRDDEFGA